jgi:hypothetical protein
VLWVTAFQALAQSLPAPNYDAFSDRDGNIITKEQGRALFSVLRSPGQLEAIYADAEKGSARARRVFLELETNYFPSIGREVAELTSRPACLVPVVRELSGWCIPDWSFVDFLQKDKPRGPPPRFARRRAPPSPGWPARPACPVLSFPRHAAPHCLKPASWAGSPE